MPKPSAISSKGQITIPLKVRTRLGVKPGDKVNFDFEQGNAILRPATPEANPFAKHAGALPAFNPLEEINEWDRDMRGHDSDEFPTSSSN
jgi:AbrB family looped-hinge helix DNA binding protein